MWRKLRQRLRWALLDLFLVSCTGTEWKGAVCWVFGVTEWKDMDGRDGFRAILGGCCTLHRISAPIPQQRRSNGYMVGLRAGAELIGSVLHFILPSNVIDLSPSDTAFMRALLTR